MFTLVLAVSAAVETVPLEPSLTSRKNGEFIADRYPPGALKRGEQGRVEFRLVIEPDGSLGSCEVTRSSGFKALDEETCELIIAHARTRPVRNDSGRRVRAVQAGFINWKLPGTANPAVPADQAGLENPDKIICKRIRKTGSLVARSRMCLTAQQWSSQQDESRRLMERLLDKSHTSSNGN